MIRAYLITDGLPKVLPDPLSGTVVRTCLASQFGKDANDRLV
jgi:hypothetical protein